MKFLYQPVKPFIFTQKFGENKACVSNFDNKTTIYKETEASCPIGFRSVYSMMKGHNGIDLVAKRWQPVYCAQKGRVVEVETEKERGLGVGILTEHEGKFYKHRYWHFIALNVHMGDELETGDLIGWADSTGFSTGDHLHFELKETDKFGNTLYNDNGYFGAIDPVPYMENIFALDIKGINSQIKRIRESLAILVDRLSDYLRYG